MADRENAKIREARMCLNLKDFERICEEAEICGMSISDYVRTMYIFGKLYVGGNKMHITKEEISLKIWAIKSVFDFFNADTNTTELDFLFRKQQEFERRKKIK